MFRPDVIAKRVGSLFLRSILSPPILLIGMISAFSPASSIVLIAGEIYKLIRFGKKDYSR